MNLNSKLTIGLKHKFALLVIFISSIFFSMCKENPGESNIGEKFIESKTDLNLIDTFSVNLSTVILDTVITSGTGKILVGNYRDDIFGKVRSSSYFQIGSIDSTNFDLVDADEVYDSLNLILRYNKYFFGDTTKSQKILVRQLTENIKFNNEYYITSETVFDYNPRSIGSIIFTPRPNNKSDTLRIKLSDDIGIDLFTKLKNRSEILTNDEIFMNYFHGFVLNTDDSYGGAIIGFKANETKLILHTSRKGFTTEKISYSFTLKDSTKQYNNISHDFSSTQLNSLAGQRNKLPSAKTSGLSFLQGGIGLAIRVDFPSLNEILLRGRGTIMKAQLSVSPLYNSYKDFHLPSDLIVYELGKLNIETASAFESSSTLSVDGLYLEKTSYTFDITEFIKNQIANSYIDPEKGLLISLPDIDLRATFNRLIIDTQSRNKKLKIYYLSY